MLLYTNLYEMLCLLQTSEIFSIEEVIDASKIHVNNEERRGDDSEF